MLWRNDSSSTCPTTICNSYFHLVWNHLIGFSTIIDSTPWPRIVYVIRKVSYNCKYSIFKLLDLYHFSPSIHISIPIHSYPISIHIHCHLHPHQMEMEMETKVLIGIVLLSRGFSGKKWTILECLAVLNLPVFMKLSFCHYQIYKNEQF